MQLAHLLPHLDAEIDRLQQARDLLALIALHSTDLSNTFSERLAEKNEIQQVPVADAAHANEAARSASNAAAEAVPLAAPTNSLVKERVLIRKDLLRSHRAKRGMERPVPEDSALRGHVPLGPVVVSAEEVRRSQASKTEQATRAAAMKKTGAELVSAFSWRTRSAEGRSADALLQRLLHIGEEAEENEDAGDKSRYPRVSHEQSMEAAHAPRLVK